MMVFRVITMMVVCYNQDCNDDDDDDKLDDGDD